MLAEVRSFDDSQQHAGSILGWNQVYDQLGRGHLSSELQQVAAERFQIFQETLDKRVVQHGCAPRGRLCIAMSLGTGRFPVVQGYEAGPQSVPLLRDGEEFLLHAPEGMSFFAINIDAERFARLAEVELSREQLGALRTQPQMAVSRAVLERVRSRIQPVFSALVKGDIALDRACEARLEEQLLETFLDLFIHARDTPGAAVAMSPCRPTWCASARKSPWPTPTSCRASSRSASNCGSAVAPCRAASSWWPACARWNTCAPCA